MPALLDGPDGPQSGRAGVIAQYLQLVLGLSPCQAGLWTLPSSLGFLAGSLLVPSIVRHVRPGYVMAAGLLVTAMGFLILVQVPHGGLAVLVIGSVVFATGLAPVFTLAADLMVGAAPPERAGAAAAVSETSSELGGALGIAILGSLGTAVYRGRMAHAEMSHLPVDAEQAARDTLGGALAVAERLAEPLATAVSRHSPALRSRSDSKRPRRQAQ